MLSGEEKVWVSMSLLILGPVGGHTQTYTHTADGEEEGGWDCSDLLKSHIPAASNLRRWHKNTIHVHVTVWGLLLFGRFLKLFLLLFWDVILALHMDWNRQKPPFPMITSSYVIK